MTEKLLTVMLNFNSNKSFLQVILDVVDIDSAMVSIATEWFGFAPDDKMRASVADGIQMITSESDKGYFYF